MNWFGDLLAGKARIPGDVTRDADTAWAADVRTFAPSLLRRPLVLRRQDEREGRVVELRAAYSVVLVDNQNRWLPTQDVAMVPLGRSLPRFLVSNDFFLKPSTWTSAPGVDVPTPADTDSFDGKVWRIHCDDVALAQTLLTAAVWELLEAAGRRARFTWVIDGDQVLMPISTMTGRMPKLSDELARFATLVDALVSAGALDRWPDGPDPSELPDLALWPGRSWHVQTPELAVRGWVQEVWRSPIDLQVDGEVDGVGFRAVRSGPSTDMPVHGLVEMDPAFTRGLVMVPTGREVPDHVRFRYQPVVGSGNVHTEWLDFDDEFAVSSHDDAIGHQVATPLLMQYLYDHRVRSLEVKDAWVFARLRRFDPEHVEQMVRVLAGARDFLPSYL